MGAFAEAFVAYAQPFIDACGGSEAGLNRAMAMAQLCWNLALLPENEREKAIGEMRPKLEMTDEKFAEFRQRLVLPMIDRHYEMFPGLHQAQIAGSTPGHLPPGPHVPSAQPFDAVEIEPSQGRKQPAAGRNAPCPCGSGRKYKHCCGARK